MLEGESHISCNNVQYLYSAFIYMDIIKCALQHFVMKIGCYVTDDGGKYVTFHKLNRRSRKG